MSRWAVVWLALAVIVADVVTLQLSSRVSTLERDCVRVQGTR